MPNMLDLTAVKQQRQEWMDKASAVLKVVKEEGRDPSEEEMAAVEECTAAIDVIDADVFPRAQKIHDTMNKIVASREPATRASAIASAGGDGASLVLPSRYQRVKNFKGTINGKKPEERAYEFGHWILHTINQQLPGRYDFAASTEICKDRGILNVAQTNDNANAGVFVPEQFGLDLILLRETFGVARQVVEMMPMTSDTRTDPRWVDGLTAFFTGEGAVIPESDATWDNILLVAKDLTAITRMSSQLSADSAINYGDTLVREIAYAFSNKEDEVTFNGTGSAADGGIVGVRTKLQSVDGAGADSFGLVTQATSNTWPTIVIQDFHETIGKCPQFSLIRGPQWICSTTFYHTVMAPLAIAQAGGATIAEAGGSVGGATTGAQFLGFPVVFSQVYPIATAVDLVSCTFGAHDAGVRFGDRQQESILFSEHASVGGQSVFERNQIAVRGTERMDVVVHSVGDTLATVAGAIVGLQTGS